MVKKIITALVLGMFVSTQAYASAIVVNDQAEFIETDTSGFNNNLSASDDTVQKALDTIDNISLSGGSVSDAVYGAGWNGDTTTAPSKNAVYDKIETISVGDALTGSPLSQFAATTSEQLRGVLSDETGTGIAYFVGGALGIPSSVTLTNASGTAASLTAGLATALAADPTDCPAGSYTVGINASGTAQGCTDATTEIDSAIATHASNDSAHHAPVTVSDSSEIDLTVAGQQISAAIVPASIDEAKLDASVNASLGLADSALQSYTETDSVVGAITGIVKANGAGVISAASAGTDYVAPNAGITGATKTKITYDAKGLVTAGADATTADIADSTNRRYVTDAEATVIDNTSGTNTGDQSLTAYQLKPSEGAFVDGDKTKLNGIEASADVTDTANVTSAGALMDSEVDADLKTLSLPANTTISTFGALLVDDANEATFKATVNLEIGTDVQAYDADLDDLADGSLTGSKVSAASSSAVGVVELAIASEVDTGTDTTRAITADALAGSNLGEKAVSIQVLAGATAATVADGHAYLLIPSSVSGMNLVEVVATVVTAGTTGTMDIQLHNVTSAADILSTKITIDTAEKSSSTAATPAVISGTEDDVAANDVLRVDIDVIHTTPAAGLMITLVFRLP